LQLRTFTKQIACKQWPRGLGPIQAISVILNQVNQSLGITVIDLYFFKAK
jgi:hypothetical protein